MSFPIWMFWLLLALVMFVIEVCTVSLVSIWFTLGALAAALAAFLGGPLWLQIVLFAGISGILFYFCKEKLSEYFRFRHDQSGASRILGKSSLALNEIGPGCNGRIRVEGMDWKASSSVRIPAGSKVRITGMHGVTVDVVLIEPKAALPKTPDSAAGPPLIRKQP